MKGTNLSVGQVKVQQDYRTLFKIISRTALVVVILASLLFSTTHQQLKAQLGGAQPQSGASLEEAVPNLLECLKNAGDNEEKQNECLKQAAGEYLKQLPGLPEELGAAKQCLGALASAGVKLGNRSVAEKYQGQPGKAVEFLWTEFEDCLKSLIPGLELVVDVIKALIPKAPNSLVWFPIPDPPDGLRDVVAVLQRAQGSRTAQILNATRDTVIAEKPTLPFAHEWGAESLPGCLVPEIIWVRPEARLGPVPTYYGDLQTAIGITSGASIVNIPLPRFVKFWGKPVIGYVGCLWLYNFMLAAYTVGYELLTADEYVDKDGTVRERVSCRQTLSCEFIKKGTKKTIELKPEKAIRPTGYYQLTHVRLDDQRQSIGSGLTLTLDMTRPHELVFVWTRLTADLVIDEITVEPTPLQQGQEFNLSVKVRNIGEISALQSDRRSPISGETKVHVTAIGTTATGEATIKGGLCDQPPRDCSLQPGESRTIEVYGPATGWIAPRDSSSLSLQATIDPDDFIEEGIYGEANNTTILTIPLQTPTLPDPAFKDPKADVGYTQISNTVLRLWADVSNLSPVAASNVKVDFSTDAPEPVGARVIGEVTIPSLPGNSVRRATVDWDVCKVPAGGYMVGVSIDPNNSIQELNERNNNTGLAVTVPASANKAKLVTDKSAYQPRETVTIYFFNSCSQAISLRNSAPWVIKDSQSRLVFSPAALQVITEVRPGETKSWQWDQKDNNRQPVPAGTYTVELETMDAGTYTASFEIKALEQVKLDVKAVGRIRQGPFIISFEINVPVLVNGIPKSTPISLQFDKGKIVTLTAQQKVTVTIFGIGQRTLYFRQWECQPHGVFRNPTIALTLNQNTMCAVIYEEE